MTRLNSRFNHQWKQTWRVKPTPVCDPCPSPKHRLTISLWPSLKNEQPNTGYPPSPGPCCLPGLVCCGLPWPRTAWPVQGLELETWHNSLARRGQMKGKNRRVMGRLHMNCRSNGEGRGGVRGWRVKVNPPHPGVPRRPLPNWRADKGDEEGVLGWHGALGARTPAARPSTRRKDGE